MLVFVDEMPYTPEAIVEACVNLESGASSFEFKGLGNADDMLDPHGRMCEPKKGWNSVDVESESWETKRGVCIHLDGLKSPCITEKKKYPGLLNQDDISTTAEVYGVDSPQFWQMRRGFWAPEGIQKTVLTMPMIVRSDAFGDCSFDQSAVMLAGLDPAFEGEDRCVLRFGRCGEVNGKMTLLIESTQFISRPGTNPMTQDTIKSSGRQRKPRSKRSVTLSLWSGFTGEGGGLADFPEGMEPRNSLC
jgi:hypothetical protein